MDTRTRTRNVVVENDSGSRRSVTITIESPSGERLFRYHYRIEPKSVTIAGTFHGPAHTITIRVDESDPRTAEYIPPTGNCDSETIAIEILDSGVPRIRSHCGGVTQNVTNRTSNTSVE